MIKSKSFFVTPGLWFLQDPELASTTIYGVKRDGLGITEVTGTPGNKEFVYVPEKGRIAFDVTNPFADAPYITGPGAGEIAYSAETVWVLYNL